jgi:hypothetical protein
MLSFLPLYWPPNTPTPTHRLTYIPPIPIPSSSTPSSTTTYPPLTPTSITQPNPTPTKNLQPLNLLPKLQYPFNLNLSMQNKIHEILKQPSHSNPSLHGADESSHCARDHDCVLRRYEMKMRQQPIQARMCGVGEKCESHCHLPPRHPLRAVTFPPLP